jgi:hypothetical protein
VKWGGVFVTIQAAASSTAERERNGQSDFANMPN